MNRKILMGTTALFAVLALSLTAISPARAMTKDSYWEHVEGTVTGTPRKMWVANGIMHIKDLPFSGSYIGTLGTGTMEVNFEHIMVNTETGEGTCLGTWLIVIDGNTLSGSANGKITGGLSGISEGHFRGTHGTGDFAGIVKMGNYSVNLATGILEAEGVIIYH